MPLSYKVEDGIVHITVAGKIGVQEQKDFAQEWLSDPTLPSPLKILRDTRKQVGQSGGSLQSLKKIIGFATTSFPPDARLAILASDDLIFGSSRIFQAWLDEITNVMVFRDKDEAREWLLRPPAPDEA